MTIVKKISDKDSKFKIGYIVKISKCKIIFAKVYVPNWSEEVFVINFCDFVISDIKSEEVVIFFKKKDCKRRIKKSLELKNQ